MRCTGRFNRNRCKPISGLDIVSLVADTKLDCFDRWIVSTFDIFLAYTFSLCESRESDYRENEKELVDCVHVIFHLLRELS